MDKLGSACPRLCFTEVLREEVVYADREAEKENGTGEGEAGGGVPRTRWPCSPSLLFSLLRFATGWRING